MRMSDSRYERICSFLLETKVMGGDVPDISAMCSELGLEDFQVDNICYEFLGMDYEDLADALYAGIIKISC